MQDGMAHLLADLTGEALPSPEKLDGIDLEIGRDQAALGYSQLNELLLLAGLDRVHESFFSFLLTGTTEYDPGSGFRSLEQLAEGVTRFRKLALMQFGNVKFAFKTLSTDPDELWGAIADGNPIDESHFMSRHDPVLPLESIAPADAYLTGYLVERDIMRRLDDPADVEAVALKAQRDAVVAKSIRNQEAYYASDHMDVYVATSMREKHEFVAVQVLAKEIFEDPQLKPLKLRWFNPTQALCADRIDKGLAEALMLKRASCTIYLAQATDTLGKDSELASTLAQGKPVIAYVPEVSEEYFASHLRTIMECDPEKSENEILLDELLVSAPSTAWKDPEVQEWVRSSKEALPTGKIRKRLFGAFKALYDKRANTLRDNHPLGIQVNLATGVANGVLVARTPGECARLVRGLLTRTLQFDLEATDRHTLLKEVGSGSIFRVMTKDPMLTNTFWNFYLR
jgi:hypothetical protein